MRCLLLVALALAGCNDGPCGDPEIECWSAVPNSCPVEYFQYTGSGECPQGYWCVDPREPPAGDIAADCRDMTLPRDMSEAD